ncbi:hypothetical protein AKH08_16335 [Vibrio parahaemolyticus]|nr:hypothetical protein AKH08_16335 [Vibrio parahaemolyticus]
MLRRIGLFLTLVFIGVESKVWANGDKNKHVNYFFHGACCIVALSFSPLYQPDVKIVGLTNGRAAEAHMYVVVAAFYSAMLYLARYRGDLKTKPSKKVALEFNIRSSALLLFYGLFWYLMPVLHTYGHYGVLHWSPFDTLVIDLRKY